MVDPARICLAAAGAVYLLLALAHLLVTPHRIDRGDGLVPSEPEVAAAMARTPLRLAPAMSMWDGWVGFNLSHALGAAILGVFALAAARTADTFAALGPVVAPVGLVASAAYLWLAVRYWFRIPVVAVVVGLVLFAAAAALGRWG